MNWSARFFRQITWYNVFFLGIYRAILRCGTAGPQDLVYAVGGCSRPGGKRCPPGGRKFLPGGSIRPRPPTAQSGSGRQRARPHCRSGAFPATGRARRRRDGFARAAGAARPGHIPVLRHAPRHTRRAAPGAPWRGPATSPCADRLPDTPGGPLQGSGARPGPYWFSRCRLTPGKNCSGPVCGLG